MNIIGIISYILFLSLILYIWFDSLLIEKLTKKFHSKKLKRYMEDAPEDNLPTALVMVYNNLLFQMLSCPFCFSFWLNVVSFSVVVFTSLAPIYLYYFLPITWYLTYVCYLVLVRLER